MFNVNLAIQGCISGREDVRAAAERSHDYNMPLEAGTISLVEHTTQEKGYVNHEILFLRWERTLGNPRSARHSARFKNHDACKFTLLYIHYTYQTYTYIHIQYIYSHIRNIFLNITNIYIYIYMLYK